MGYPKKLRKAYKRHGTRFSESVQNAVRERDDYLCVYCGEKGWEIDHVLPRYRGGHSIRENGVCCCRSCNLSKLDRLTLTTLIIAFKHLLAKGESLEWLDDLWAAHVSGVRLPVSTDEKLAELLQGNV